MKTTIWKTITIGGKPKLDKDIYVSSWGQELMDKTTFSKKKETIDLVTLTPRDLGFTDMPTTQELFDEKNLAKYGVELCPAEVGPHLRAQYTNQPNEEWLYIAMNPITDSDDYPSVWDVVRFSDGCRWLLGHWASPDDRWSLGDVIVFRFRKVSDLNHSESQNLLSGTLSSILLAESSDEALERAIELCKENGLTVTKIY